MLFSFARFYLCLRELREIVCCETFIKINACFRMVASMCDICIRILQIKIVSIISLHQQKNDLHKMFKKEVIGVLLIHIVTVPFIVLMVRAGYQRHLYTASIRQRSNGEKIRVTQCCE